ncbi:MAG: hypothetical protein JST59_12705 [Actinobacteria bacterium]|nr:hypothetical protein [Actinomycetota bacterium]
MHPKDRSGGEVRTPSSQKVVPLHLPDDQRETLRETCLSALHGILGDLTRPALLGDPAATAREGEMFRRLLEALDAEEIRVPDEELRERLALLSERYAAAENAEEINRTLAAHRSVLEVLDGSVGKEEDETLRPPGPGWLPGDDASCRREVLDLLLAEAPNCLTFPEVAAALAGDTEDAREASTLKDAIRILVRWGLARHQGGALAPTRPARLVVGLGFRIG